MESFNRSFSPKSSSWLATLSRSFWCRMADVILDGLSLTSVTTSDMSVDVETALKFATAPLCEGLGVIEIVEPCGVWRGESASSLLFAKWYWCRPKIYWAIRKTLIKRMIKQNKNTNKCVRLNRWMARWWSFESMFMIDDCAMAIVTLGGSK